VPRRSANAVQPKQSLGQNFLRDPNISRKIVAAIRPRPEDVILEIGPGEGALTTHLLGRAGMLIVVEIDRRVVKYLKEQVLPPLEAGAHPAVTVLHQDILETDLSSVARQVGHRLRIIGNIPYHITSPIIFHVLKHRTAVTDLTIMMQKEVARRLAATPGTKDYGILAVLCQLHTDVRMLFDVSPNAFIPRPKVTSTVVRLQILEQPRVPIRNEQFTSKVIRGVFGKRRKTLRNSLAYLLDHDMPSTVAGVDLQRRPEELTVVELAELANALSTGHSDATKN
jgi:16S rRNA (adenine1518-N6/adenine1519-N6)-dimethyltransferase